MRREHRIAMATTTLLGFFVAVSPAPVQAQGGLTGVGRPRTEDKIIKTETPTPPPVNTLPNRVANGQVVPDVPPVGGAIDPTRALGTTGAAGERAMDPAMRLDPALRVPGRLAAYPMGMGAAIMAEHALGMAIEGSALKMIAEQSATGPAGDQDSKALLGQAERLMAESRAILDSAPADTRNVAANMPTRRFDQAARAYLETLAGLTAPGASDKIRMALVNHAVKQVLDAKHILQMGEYSSGGMAMPRLMKHARNMETEGTQALIQMGGSGPIAPAALTNVTTLARRGREVIEAAGELNAVLAAQAKTVPGAIVPVGTPIGPNPGRFQDNRPEVIGGTYGTSNPTTGTYSGKGDPLNPGGIPRINNEGAPIPSPRDRTNSTGSSGGLPPR